MGSIVELNDTLQLTSDQGFPEELDFEKHKQKSFKAEDFKDQVFEFYKKPGIRIYQSPPVRNFLVHNINGKWLYWGLVQILETTCDYQKKTTSGKFKIIYIYTLEEMQKAHELTDRNPETDFFK